MVGLQSKQQAEEEEKVMDVRSKQKQKKKNKNKKRKKAQDEDHIYLNSVLERTQHERSAGESRFHEELSEQ